jgi:HD-GYP domain-containing protein (c-di-GMP phosphodiesterase class II)
MIYLLEPIAPPKTPSVLKNIEQILEAQKRRDPSYEGHIQRACFYALEFGRWQGLPEKELRQLYLGTLFHDIGKVMIAAEIINKPGPLSSKEREIMLTHPALGENICLRLGPFEEIASLVACHHERPNGTGYPKGLKGEEISPLARVLAIIEIYDALRSERSYKKAFSLEESLGILYRDADLGNLDGGLVRDFAQLAEQLNGQHPNLVP